MTPTELALTSDIRRLEDLLDVERRTRLTFEGKITRIIGTLVENTIASQQTISTLVDSLRALNQVVESLTQRVVAVEVGSDLRAVRPLPTDHIAEGKDTP